MKFKFLIFAILLSCAAFGGEIIKTRVLVNGVEYLSTIYLDENWIKIIDQDDQMIFDLEHQKITIVNPELKTYAKADIKEFNELFTNLQRTALENAKKFGTAAERAKIEKMVNELMQKTKLYDQDLKIKATNQKTEILGYKCEAYQVIENGYVVEQLWKTNELKTHSIYKAAMAMASITPVKTYETSETYLNFLKDGAILKTEDLVDSTISTVESFIKAKIPASQFFVPAGYVEVTLLDYFQ